MAINTNYSRTNYYNYISKHYCTLTHTASAVVFFSSLISLKKAKNNTHGPIPGDWKIPSLGECIRTVELLRAAGDKLMQSLLEKQYLKFLKEYAFLVFLLELRRLNRALAWRGGQEDNIEYLYLLGILSREWLWEMWDSTQKFREFLGLLLSSNYVVVLLPYIKEILDVMDRGLRRRLGDAYDILVAAFKLLLLALFALPIWVYRTLITILELLHAILSGEVSIVKLLKQFFGMQMLYALSGPAIRVYQEELDNKERKILPLFWGAFYLFFFYLFLFTFLGYALMSLLFNYYLLAIGAYMLKWLNQLLFFLGASKPLFREFTREQIIYASKLVERIDPYRDLILWCRKIDKDIQDLPKKIKEYLKSLKTKIRPTLKILLKVLLAVFLIFNILNILYVIVGVLALLSRYLYGFKKLPYFVYDFLEAYENAGRYNAPFYGSRIDTGILGQGINPHSMCLLWWLKLTHLLIDPRPENMKNRMNFEVLGWEIGLQPYWSSLFPFFIIVPFLHLVGVNPWDPKEFGEPWLWDINKFAQFVPRDPTKVSQYWFDNWQYFKDDPMRWFFRWPYKYAKFAEKFGFDQEKIDEALAKVQAATMAQRAKMKREYERERAAEKAAAAEKRAAEIKAQREAEELEFLKEVEKEALENEAKKNAEREAFESEAQKKAAKSQTKNAEAKQEPKASSKKNNAEKNRNKNGKNGKNGKKK